ncbi:uncharacterized protein LOC142350607 [Convolutriloba macropyga]|uniref:uncharacterized protein LOC142350607 n=1 Tax=Convolutriloba macropyga TaxID=536237 RepID=UPI003F52306A
MPIVPADESLLIYAKSVLKPTTIHRTTHLGQVFEEKVGAAGIETIGNVSTSSADDFFVVNDRCDESCGKLKPYLFVGSEDLSRNLEKMKEIGFTHIVNLATYCPNSFPDNFTYLNVEIFDMPEKDIKQHFQKIIDFVEVCRNSGGCVYVHCNAGISRAPTCCIAYLMWKDKVTKSVAFEYMRSKRWVLPNPGFMEQLDQFEKELNQVGSTAAVDPES